LVLFTVLLFLKTDSNLSCIVCDSSNQPSCKLTNQLDGFLTKCKVDQHYCQTTIINMSKGNSSIIRKCSSDNTNDIDCTKQNEPSCMVVKSCNTDGCNSDNSAGNFNLNHLLSLICLLTAALLMRWINLEWTALDIVQYKNRSVLLRFVMWLWIVGSRSSMKWIKQFISSLHRFCSDIA